MKLKYCLISVGFSVLAPAAWAVASAPNPLGEHKSNAPIEINSDKLDVLQQQNLAIFTGHVVAIQEDKRLKSDIMRVYYTKKPGTSAPGAPPTPKPEKPAATPGAAPGDGDSIKKIEVEGHVLFTTPKDTASGLSGVYDPIKHEIQLFDQVVMTQGPNTLKGDHLVYNLDTGKSVVTGNAPPDKGPGKQRVHMLIIQEKKQDTPKPDNKPPVSGGTPSPKAAGG